MSLLTIFIYLGLSFLLFFILNMIDKRSGDNYFDYVIICVIYILVVSGILHGYGIVLKNDNIFIIIIFELFIRMFDSNYIKEKNYFKDNIINKKKYLCSFIAVYFTNILFINHTDNVFPKIENMKIIIWVLIIIYIYSYFKDKKEIKSSKISDMGNIDKRREYVIVNYAKYKNRYSSVVTSKYRELILVVYTIIIYENQKRPEFFRNIDKFIYQFSHKRRRYGIMQIESYYPIDDVKSIKLGIKKLEKIYDRMNNHNNKDLKLVFKKYYKDTKDIDNIMFIYDTISDFEGQKK